MSDCDKKAPGIDGLVYRVPGPNVGEHYWIAHSTTGHVIGGSTPEEAVATLKAGLAALAEHHGQPLEEWLPTQALEGTRVLRDGELLQAQCHPGGLA